MIPDLGAGKYWYVDPRAQGVSSPDPIDQTLASIANPLPYDPMRQYKDQQATTYNERIQELRAQMIEDRNRGIQEHDEGPTPEEKVRYPGMVWRGNMDDEAGVEGTGVFGIDGVQYILPTQVDGVKLTLQQILDRFRQSGEHLGGFNNVQSARFFENTLQPQPQALRNSY